MPHLNDIAPDLVAVQECARPANRQRGRQAWFGDNPNQGLLVGVTNGLRLRAARKKGIDSKFFLPIQVEGALAFNVLAIWAKPGPHSPIYASTVLDGLAAYRRFIKSGPTVFLGDLNTATIPSARGRDWHMEIVKRLRDEFGLVSAYHAYHNIEHGYEAHYTYFDRTKKGKPYHVDYCFVPEAWLPRLKRVAVGNYEEWGRVSDHTPVVVEIG